MELVLLIFLISLSIELIEFVGKETLLNLFYAGYKRITTTSNTNTTKLKAEILNYKTELSTISSQNEFAKWAKLRRKQDKAIAQLESINAINSTVKSSFSTKFKATLWIFTTILPFIISFYYRKQSVFYLPNQWFNPITFFLSLPSAPTGGIATGIWTMVCKRFITVIKNVIINLKTSDSPIVVPASASAQTAVPVSVGGDSTGSGSGLKKEL